MTGIHHDSHVQNTQVSAIIDRASATSLIIPDLHNSPHLRFFLQWFVSLTPLQVWSHWIKSEHVSLWNYCSCCPAVSYIFFWTWKLLQQKWWLFLLPKWMRIRLGYFFIAQVLHIQYESSLQHLWCIIFSECIIMDYWEFIIKELWEAQILWEDVLASQMTSKDTHI